MNVEREVLLQRSSPTFFRFGRLDSEVPSQPFRTIPPSVYLRTERMAGEQHLKQEGEYTLRERQTRAGH